MVSESRGGCRPSRLPAGFGPNEKATQKQGNYIQDLEKQYISNCFIKTGLAAKSDIGIRKN